MSKENNIKEKFKIALISTEKAISDDYLNKDTKIKKKTNESDYFEIDSLNSKEEFIKYRAESDSRGLKKKFSDQGIYKSNYPKILHAIPYMNFQKRFVVSYLVLKCSKDLN